MLTVSVVYNLLILVQERSKKMCGSGERQYERPEFYLIFFNIKFFYNVERTMKSKNIISLCKIV